MALSRCLFFRFLCGCLLAGLIFFLNGEGIHAQQVSAPAAETEGATIVPSLADVVYQAGALVQRLETLKRKIDTVDGLKRMTDRLTQTSAQTDRFKTRLESINAEDLQSYQQLAILKGEVRNEADDLKRLVETLTERVKRVEEWRKTWNREKKRWRAWRAALESDPAIPSVTAALNRADGDIEQALSLINQKLEPMLGVQQQAGEMDARVNGLINQINAILDQQRGGALRGGTPSMFSLGYLRQLIELLHEPDKIVTILPLPHASFYAEKGWVIGLQIALFGFLFSMIRRHRPMLLGQVNRRFLGKRQIAVPLFVAIFTLTFFYGAQPDAWRMLMNVLASVATARLATAFVTEAWIKRSITILVVVVILFQSMLALNVPLALMRLFIFIWSGAGLLYFGWRVRQAVIEKKPAWQIWLIRIVTLMFALIAVADIIGFGGFAVQLMDSALRSVVLLLMGWAMVRLARVAMELGAEALPMGGLSFLRTNSHAILSRVTVVVNVLIGAFMAAHLLVAWKIFALPSEALREFFGFGITVGGHDITLGLVLIAGLILYGAFVISWGLQTLLMENVLNRGQMDTGARLSIARLVHYALVLVGFLIALSSLGFDLKSITIIGGALGVGIGFGMQAIVNNFVSGLILLFERPIKVGDVIQLGDGHQGRVTNLGLRATTVQTFDRAEIVVPNGDLISSQVTNWTLGDRIMRLIIPVGVAYGSDVETVMRVLMDVAKENEKVLKDPPPVVLFLNFGDSSLDFQLRVWIADFADRRFIQSALIREIDRRFRSEEIEIPFPQRDLHLRSVDDTAAEQLNGDSRPPTRSDAPVVSPEPESN